MVSLNSARTVEAHTVVVADSFRAADNPVAITASPHTKCARCWHHREDVGSHPDHPEICGRCVDNIEGQGEVRHYA